MMDYRRELHANGVADYEGLHRYAGWRDQAVKLMSLDPTYIRDLCRDHVWRFDHTPARRLEREQSMVRTLDLAMQDRAPALQRTSAREPARAVHREHAQTPVRQRLRDLAAALDGSDEASQGAALRITLFERDEREHDRDAGLGF
jgi:hypothetical protein